MTPPRARVPIYTSITPFVKPTEESDHYSFYGAS